jgi:large repetitive protein
VTVSVQGLGPLIDLATALGLVGADGQLDSTWFASPGDHVAKMLRTQVQREALLRAANQLLAHGAPPVVDDAGRQWIEVVSEGGVAVHVVVSVVNTATEIGIGVRVHTADPDSQVRAYVPLVSVPPSGAASVPFSDGTGRVSVEAEVVFNGPAPAPKEPGLKGVVLGVRVATNGRDPEFRVTLRGLQLPGQSAPSDVGVHGTLADLEAQALPLVLGLIRQSVSGANGEVSELLALIGITDDAGIPPLPLADLLSDGLAAWGRWLEAVLASSTAIDQWLFHVKQLMGPGATVVPAAGPGLPHRVKWTLANGLSLAVVVRAARTAAGAPTLEIGIEGVLASVGIPSGAVELSATLTRITLGAAPSVFGLPALVFSGRIGPSVVATAADRLLNLPDPSPKVGSLSAGIALGEDRTVGFVLAAHDVVVGAHSYAVLDLTNAQTLADVAGNAVADLSTAVLDNLGTAGTAVRVLLGLTKPDGEPAWPVALTAIPSFLANPSRALVDYHQRVLATHRAGYPAVLDPLRHLLTPPGVDVPISGGGVESDPWRLALTNDTPSISIVAWEAGTRLELGAAVDIAVADLGGGCPTVSLSLLARLASIAFDGSGSHVVPGVSAELTFGARGNIPLRIGDSSAAVVANRAGIALSWTPADGVRAAVALPGLSAIIDGEEVAIALPTIAGDGRLGGEVPWRGFELLVGHVLSRLGPLWAMELGRLLGWLPGQRASVERLPLETLARDPLAAVRHFAATLVKGGALVELSRALALVVTGPSATDVPAGVHSGRGDADAPLAIALAGGASAAIRLELLLWADADPTGDDGLVPADLIDELGLRAGDLNPSPSGERLAAALRSAADRSADVADLLADRGDIATGLQVLAARWAETDGLVRTVNAVLPGATIHEIEGATHLTLPTHDIAGLTGVAMGSGTIVVVGALALEAWPGIAADRVIDLRAPGLPPEAFDIARVSTEDGPWLVRLPTRRDAVVVAGDDGAELQLARLARVVDAVVARAAGDGPVVLIGHGAGGHTATQAASRAGVTHLITLGTPHGGIDLSVLEAQPAAGAVQLLATLVPAANLYTGEGGPIGLGRGLLAALAAAYATESNPLPDLVPPSGLTSLRAGVEVHCIRGRSGPGDVAKAMCALVARGLQDLATSRPPGPQPLSETLNLGLGLTVDPPASTGEVHLTVALALTGQVFAAGDGPNGLRVRVSIGRAGGWLAGGPDPARPPNVSPHPSLRRACIEVDLPAAGAASARLVFHDASALGTSRRRWVVGLDASGDPLLPEAQVLVGRIAAALGPLPASGPIRGFVDLLCALGLTDSTAAIPTGGAVGFSADGVRALIVDPGGLFAAAVTAARAGRTASALASLLGAAAPSATAPTEFVLQLGALSVRADVAARTIRIQATALQLEAGATVDGSVELGRNGSVTAQGAIAFGEGTAPNGRPVLAVVTTPLAVRLLWEGAGNALPVAIALAPKVDAPGIARLLATVVPAQMLWAGITFVRLLQPGAVALIDPVLQAIGLLAGSGATGRVVVPTALLGDPAHWLTHETVLGELAGGLDTARVKGLVEVIANLVGLPQAEPGVWTLPYGIELRTASSSGRVSLSLGVEEPVAGTGLRMAGAVGLLLGTRSESAAPTADLTLALPGETELTSAGRITLSLGPNGLVARLVMPGRGIDLELLPEGPGLAAVGAAAAAAVTYALPLVLDAIAGVHVGHPARGVGVALGALGDTLGLRSKGKFVATELMRLGAHPGPEFAARLAQKIEVAFDKLAALLAPAVPAGYSLSRDGSALVFAHTGDLPFQLSVTVPGGAVPTGVRATASIRGVHPFAGAVLGGAIALDEQGLDFAVVTFAVDYANAMRVGPINLAPTAEIAIGRNPAGGARVAMGLAVDAMRTVKGVLRLTPSPTFGLEATGGPLAEALVRLAIPPALNVALSVADVQTLLGTVVLRGPTVRELLDQVLITGNRFDEGLLDPTQVWPRLLTLAGRIAGHTPALPIAPLTLKISSRGLPDGDVAFGVSLSLPPGERFNLITDDITVQIEVDASWVNSVAGTDGLVIELLRMHGATPSPFFGITVRGIGVRVARKAGKLLDTYVSIDSLALHSLLVVTSAGGVTDVGGQLEFGNLAIAFGSATGGTNKVATGLMKDSASGAEKPQPRFSPALAVQSHAGGAPRFDLRAGPDPGPWWLAIQHAFGPVYIEQVGFGVTRDGDKVMAARIIVDGKVTIMGLTVAVDDLAVGMTWPKIATDPAPYDPHGWTVDLAGLAVSMNTSGVSLAGGLSKVNDALPDYVGMITIRFSVYAITAYGGYSVLTDASGDFTSLFIYGALCAPIGGLPAFFVTGIGAGVGVNRRLLLPADLNDFPAYPLLQALDRTSPMADPGTALASLRAYFPPARGAFWFAAGISFNSFTLIDGIVVVAVAIGDGLEINLLGLAKAALPNPSFPLVQIELALVARFSTKDGVLWIQAQLTDNSFLLARDCRLTGGFAFVTWFSGDKAGQFVVTLGGYHPSFHRDGYPIVPRLGFVWCVSNVLVIKGESYFALVSEAIMAGARFEASLTLGPLWAYLRLGADGIVYFDPFHFQVTAFAEIGAGITIDIDFGWFGHLRITVSLQLHADVLLEGPEFHGSATIDIDVASATIAFGDWGDRSTHALTWSGFADKYLRPGGAAMLTLVTGRGTFPPSAAGSNKAATGGSADPYLVLPEFEMTVTTTAATTAVSVGHPRPLPNLIHLAIGVMQVAAVTSTLSVSVSGPGPKGEYADDFSVSPLIGQFPKAAWAAQAQSEPKPTPAGDTVEAVSGLTLQAAAVPSVGTVPIAYHQVEIGKRLQLPFLAETAARGARTADVQAAALFVERAPSGVKAVMEEAFALLTKGPNGAPLSRLGAATFGASRSAPPQLVPLTHGMAVKPGRRVSVGVAAAPAQRPPTDTRARPLRVEALLVPVTTATAAARVRTTVGAAFAGVPRTTLPGVAAVKASLDVRLPLRLVRASATSAIARGTVLAAGRVPETGRAGAGGEQRRQRGQAPWRADRLTQMSKALSGPGIDLVGGELAVLTTDNGGHDVEKRRPALLFAGGLSVRVVAMDTVGEITLDVTLTEGTVLLPKHTERVVVIGGIGPPAGAAGWHSGTQLVQVGARVLIGPSCTVTSSALVTRRGLDRVSTGFVAAADAVDGYSIVTTRLPSDVTAVAIVLETADRVDDARGDVVNLGIAGADRARDPDGKPRPPQVIVAGSRLINVYDVRPGGEGRPIDVTVASGEHLHLGGVLGGRNGVGSLTERLRRSDVAEVLGGGFDAPHGLTRIRWVPQKKKEPARTPRGVGVRAPQKPPQKQKKAKR